MDNVSIFKLALSNSAGMMKLVVPYYNRQASSKSNEAIQVEIENIKTSTIDIFIDTNKIERLNIINVIQKAVKFKFFKEVKIQLLSLSLS